MSSFPAANLITRLSFTPQSRLLSLPWLKRNVVRCFSHKGGGPQSPVRYIPKKFRDVVQPQCSSSEDKTPKDAIRARNGKLGHDKTLTRTHDSPKTWIDHEQSNLSNGVNEYVKHGERTAEAKCLKTRQEVVEHMNTTQELQVFKKEGQRLGYASNLEDCYNDGFRDTEHRTESSRASRVDHEQSNVSFDDAHGVNNDTKRCERVVETKFLKPRQEVVKYVNMSHNVQELQDFKKDGQGLGCASNRENGYDDGFTDAEYRTKGSRASRIDHEQSNVSSDDAREVHEDIKRGERAVETKCLKSRQEVVEYMNMPQQAGQELENFEDSPSLGYASNPENNDEIIGTVCMEVLGNGGRLGYESNPVSSYDYEFTETEFVELPEEDTEEAELHCGIRDGKQKKSNTFKTKQDAEKVAIELLAKRAYTAVELRKKLNAKNFPVKVVDAVVSDFRDRGLINDSLYAEVYSHSRWNSSTWGPRRIKQALVKKGVSKGKVEKAVKLVFEDDKDCDQSSSIKLSNSSLQKLYEQAFKQWQRSQSAPHEIRKARLIRWLQYRGFDWGVISFILNRLKA